jgi:hypothetical protein
MSTGMPSSARSAPPPATIREFLTYVLPGFESEEKSPSWPPDAFGIAAALLQKSGAYKLVLQKWPPKALGPWVETVRGLGLDWRAQWLTSRSMPAQVASWWNTILQSQTSTIASIRQNDTLCGALLQLSAAADEASSGFGVPPGEQLRALRVSSGEPDDVTRNIIRQANLVLELDKAASGSTLCKHIHPSRLRVLPKLHVPQNGLTIRSLSRNLALCTGEEIHPEWTLLPTSATALSGAHSFNLLLLPWPRTMKPSQFVAVPLETRPSNEQMPDGFRFFGYDPAQDEIPTEAVVSALEKARSLVGNISGVVLPELSVPSDGYEALRDVVLGTNAFLIAGVVKAPSAPGEPGENVAYFSVPTSLGAVSYDQSKHHRWKLDKSQIIQYGLGSILDPTKIWWEHIRIGSRKLNFVAINEWLTLSVLICEDLARPDPVGDMVRAVGPNLVVALLMDGPQLASRWSSRYATVLADDPGCSVLSITSHGMAKLCRPPHISSKPNVVALWKDAKSGSPIEIEIGPNDLGAVLCLTVQYLEEFTADGRSDHCTTGYPILAGIHPVPA